MNSVPSSNVYIGGEGVRFDSILANYMQNKRGYHDLARCISCSSIYQIITNNIARTSNPKLVTDVWVSPTSLHVFVPEAVRKDWAEALTGYKKGMNNSAAAMFRRALERTCNIKGFNSGKLWEKVETMLAPFPSDLQEYADLIRWIGNDAAHPTDDISTDVPREEVEDLKDFFEILMENIFIRPERRKKLKEKHNQRKSSH